jgi:hypothetical protein
MDFSWINYPVMQIGILGVGLAASLILWIGAKFELRAMRRKTADSIKAIESEMRNLTAALEEIRTAKQAAPEPVALPMGQALNLTKRAQVLRMHNRGESVHSIAAALQIPTGEVSLLLKIERLADSELATAAR